MWYFSGLLESLCFAQQPHECSPRFPWIPMGLYSHGHLWLWALAFPKLDCLSTFIYECRWFTENWGPQRDLYHSNTSHWKCSVSYSSSKILQSFLKLCVLPIPVWFSPSLYSELFVSWKFHLYPMCRGLALCFVALTPADMCQPSVNLRLLMKVFS